MGAPNFFKPWMLQVVAFVLFVIAIIIGAMKLSYPAATGLAIAAVILQIPAVYVYWKQPTGYFALICLVLYAIPGIIFSVIGSKSSGDSSTDTGGGGDGNKNPSPVPILDKLKSSMAAFSRSSSAPASGSSWMDTLIYVLIGVIAIILIMLVYHLFAKKEEEGGGGSEEGGQSPLSSPYVPVFSSSTAPTGTSHRKKKSGKSKPNKAAAKKSSSKKKKKSSPTKKHKK